MAATTATFLDQGGLRFLAEYLHDREGADITCSQCQQTAPAIWPFPKPWKAFCLNEAGNAPAGQKRRQFRCRGSRQASGDTRRCPSKTCFAYIQRAVATVGAEKVEAARQKTFDYLSISGRDCSQIRRRFRFQAAAVDDDQDDPIDPVDARPSILAPLSPNISRARPSLPVCSGTPRQQAVEPSTTKPTTEPTSKLTSKKALLPTTDPVTKPARLSPKLATTTAKPVTKTTAKATAKTTARNPTPSLPPTPDESKDHCIETLRYLQTLVQTVTLYVTQDWPTPPKPAPRPRFPSELPDSEADPAAAIDADPLEDVLQRLLEPTPSPDPDNIVVAPAKRKAPTPIPHDPIRRRLF